MENCTEDLNLYQNNALTKRSPISFSVVSFILSLWGGRKKEGGGAAKKPLWIPIHSICHSFKSRDKIIALPQFKTQLLKYM